MKRKIEKKFHKTLNGMDLFANHVHLNFKKKSVFTSTLGGIMSIFVSVIFLLYAQSKVSLVNRPRGEQY